MKNIVIITLDDVSFYNLGFTNFFKHSQSPTPNIDKLANESYVFWNAHCNIPFCQPSRMVLLTGLYPQNNGSTEFKQIKPFTPTLCSILKNKKYYTLIIGKREHHKPDSSFNWNNDFYFNEDELDFYLSLREEPYFLLINIENTHRPFLKSKKIFEGEMPNFLSDNYQMRGDLGKFFESLKKADEVVGLILDNLKSDDLVVLTSDHGFSFPFIKGNCYGFSTNVPMIIKDQNIIKKQDKENVVSHVDFMPTISNILNFEGSFDGNSYFELLKGESNENHKYVYSQLNRMLAGPECKIRSISDKNYCYCINFNKHFPGDFVDGWGFDDALSSMNKNHKNKFYKRNFEEFIMFEEMNYYECKNISIKNKLKKKLLKTMKKFKDPALEESQKIIKNLIKFN